MVEPIISDEVMPGVEASASPVAQPAAPAPSDVLSPMSPRDVYALSQILFARDRSRSASMRCPCNATTTSDRSTSTHAGKVGAVRAGPPK